MSKIDKYSMYSQAVSQETRNESDTKNVISIINDFKKIKSTEEAKKYLNEKLRIKDKIQNFPISGKSYLSIIEKNNVFVVQFETEKDSYSFSYKNSI